ncbi:MAG: hypothetical protein ACLQLG_14590 [Thermoguttaceae bacterium]
MSDLDLSNAGEPLPADDHIQPPRLSILHLLLWTTVAAVLFKFNMAVAAVVLRAMAGMHGKMVATSIVNRVIAPTRVIMYAAGLVGLGILIVSKIRGRRGRLQPGHWMLAVEASLYAGVRVPEVALLLTSMVHQGAPFRFQSWYMYFTWIPLVAACLCRAGFYFWASHRTTDGRRWTALFACLAVLAVIVALWPAVPWVLVTGGRFGMLRLVARLPIPVNAVLCSTLLVVILLDVRVPRDWLHWLGIALVGGGAALELLRSVCQALHGI